MSTVLDEAAVAERYGIPQRTLTRWRYENSGPPFMRLGRAVRYSLEDLQRWEAERKTTPKHVNPPTRRKSNRSSVKPSRVEPGRSLVTPTRKA